MASGQWLAGTVEPRAPSPQQMKTGPPSRSLISEVGITALIYVGALAASFLSALCISAVIVAMLPGDNEGSLFLQPMILACVGLLFNPAILVSIAANHCRRVPAYYVPLTPILWLGQFGFVWREHVVFGAGSTVVVVVTTCTGILFGYWMLRRKKLSFRTESPRGRPLAASH